MPIIRIEMLAGRTQKQKQEITEYFTEGMARIGNCTPDSVHVVITDVQPTDWGVGGVLVSQRRK